MSKFGSDPAFPFKGNPKDVSFPLQDIPIYKGLSKREYFAGEAMKGFLSNSVYIASIADATPGSPEKAAKIISLHSLIHADALLAELEK